MRFVCEAARGFGHFARVGWQAREPRFFVFFLFACVVRLNCSGIRGCDVAVGRW